MANFLVQKYIVHESNARFRKELFGNFLKEPANWNDWKTIFNMYTLKSIFSTNQNFLFSFSLPRLLIHIFFFLLVLIASDVTSSCPEHSTVVYFSWFLRGQRIPFVESYGNAQWILYSVVKYAFHIDVFLYRWFLRNTENCYIWGQKSVGLHSSIGYLHMESLPRTLTEPPYWGWHLWSRSRALIGGRCKERGDSSVSHVLISSSLSPLNSDWASSCTLNSFAS